MNLRNILGVIILFTLYSCDKPASQTEQATASAAEKAEVIETSNTTAAETSNVETPKTFAAFQFEKSTHDFGEIKQGDIVKHTFKFTNIGEAPLLISDIRTTCGCTTPNYTREPIAPGESGEIDVQFNSNGKSGVQNKVITIFANTEKQRETVSITTSVKVEKKMDGPFKVQ